MEQCYCTPTSLLPAPMSAPRVSPSTLSQVGFVPEPLSHSHVATAKMVHIPESLPDATSYSIRNFQNSGSPEPLLIGSAKDATRELGYHRDRNSPYFPQERYKFVKFVSFLGKIGWVLYNLYNTNFKNILSFWHHLGSIKIKFQKLSSDVNFIAKHLVNKVLSPPLPSHRLPHIPGDPLCQSPFFWNGWGSPHSKGYRQLQRAAILTWHSARPPGYRSTYPTPSLPSQVQNNSIHELSAICQWLCFPSISSFNNSLPSRIYCSHITDDKRGLWNSS